MSFAILTGEFNVSIPRIRVTDAGVEEYLFTDFDFDSKKSAASNIAGWLPARARKTAIKNGGTHSFQQSK